MNLIKAVWDLMNGKKFNTGTIVILAAFILQKIMNIESTEANNIVTNIMMGIGGVTAVVGYIHQAIKQRSKK